MRDKVKLTVKELAILHNYNIDFTKEHTIQETFNNIVREQLFKEFILSKYNCWSDFVRKIRMIYFDPRNERYISSKCKLEKHLESPKVKSAFEEANKIINESAELKKILECFKESYQILYNGKLFTHNELLNESEDKKQKVIEWICGKWLEDYVFYNIAHNLDNPSLSYGKSLEVCRNRNPTYNQKTIRFEIDCYVIRGYQFFAISVTTDEKRNICKLKAFEVLHRAQQVGGDEARAILVTGISNRQDDPSQSITGLEEDLYKESGSIVSKLKIFGRDDWGNIHEKIYEYIYAKNRR